MEKRKLIIGDYDTDHHGQWTMSFCRITKASQIRTLQDIPGGYAPLDLSTYLTDGQPYYGTALLEATLESSEGNRQDRQLRIDAMVNYLDGKKLKIFHPDHPYYYMLGLIHVQPEYNDLAHCAVSISATCDPWMRAVRETVVNLTATVDEQTVQLINAGRLAVVPAVKVTGEVRLVYLGSSWALSEGEYFLPELYLTPGTSFGMPGVHELFYSGTGTITITYREAVLAA